MALDIAPGERLRNGAIAHWDKQLYNGDVVIVDALEASEHPDGGEPSVLIKGHTPRDGRDVTFRHDDILDWYGNIRLSHGYALTLASAQGLTVDHAFLLADERLARETIYPAAARHREGMDIYIDRRPIAFDIEAQRLEDQAGEPVSDQDVLELLARRWSRAHPKVAATDYYATPEQRNRALLDPTHTTRGSVANLTEGRSNPGRRTWSTYVSALARRSCSNVMASVRTHGPTPKARSTILASPTMPPWMANIRAWPLRSARITSKPLIVA